MDEDLPPLSANVDQQQQQECVGPGAVVVYDKKRKVGKQPPPTKPKGKASTTTTKKKAKTKAAASTSIADEEGEEEEDGDVENENKQLGGDENDETGVKIDEKNGDKKVAAKAKAKGKIRDASKGKKFLELFHDLPGELQQHWAGLKRSEQTDFVHAGVERSEVGKLSLNLQSLWKLKMKKEEKQKSQEKLSGCVLEDLLRDKPIQQHIVTPTWFAYPIESITPYMLNTISAIVCPLKQKYCLCLKVVLC